MTNHVLLNIPDRLNRTKRSPTADCLDNGKCENYQGKSIIRNELNLCISTWSN